MEVFEKMIASLPEGLVLGVNVGFFGPLFLSNARENAIVGLQLHYPIVISGMFICRR